MKMVSFGLPDELDLKLRLAEPVVQTRHEPLKATIGQQKTPQYDSSYCQGPMQDALKGIRSTSESSDLASLKVIELAKRLRELTACLLTERTKNRQLEDKVRMLEAKLNQTKQNTDSAVVNISPQGSNVGVTQSMLQCTQCQSMKTVLEKLTKSELIITSLRNENHTIKSDLKEARIILELETGEKIDNVHLWLKEIAAQRDKTSDHSGKSLRGWKGRQQQIVLLKEKVNKLESRLNSSARLEHPRLVEHDEELDKFAISEASGATMLGLESLFLNPENPLEFSCSIQCPTFNQQQYVQRQNKLIFLEQDRDRLSNELGIVKSKYDKAKSRVNSLTADVKEFKLRIEKLLDKGRHDDELIKMLVDNNKTLQESLKTELERNVKAEQERTWKFEHLLSTFNQKKNEVEKLEKILSQKDEELFVLEKELKVLQENDNNTKEQLETITPSKREEMLAKEVSLLQIERDGLRKLIESINSRVDTLLDENSRLQMECIMFRDNKGYNNHLKSQKPNRIESTGSKISSSMDSSKLGCFNQNVNSSEIDHLVSREFMTSTLSKANLSASAASIVAKRMSELQKALSHSKNELDALKCLRNKLQTARKEDFNLLTEVVKQLQNCNADENALE